MNHLANRIFSMLSHENPIHMFSVFSAATVAWYETHLSPLNFRSTVPYHATNIFIDNLFFDVSRSHLLRMCDYSSVSRHASQSIQELVLQHGADPGGVQKSVLREVRLLLD